MKFVIFPLIGAVLGGCVVTVEPGDPVLGLQPSEMPAYCRAEAANALGVRGRRIRVTDAQRAGRGWVVRGEFPRRAPEEFFRCRFDRDGQFVRIRSES